MTFPAFQQDDVKSDISQKLPDQQFLLFTTKEEDLKTAETKKPNRAHEYEKENTRSVCLLEQKRKVVSSNIDVPPARKSSEELDMDKVTAAMVLTSLSTSPLVRSPPVRPNESLNGSWKEGGFVPSSTSSSGYWSWNAPSDQSNPSTPSPPLSADSFKAFRTPSQPDDGIDEAETSNLLFDEPIPRKRKNSMKVMFKCLWKNCGKVLSTAAGIQKHIRTIHLGRVGESDYSDGEEDFYYTEIRLNTDSVADGLSSLSPVSPSLASPPSFPSQDAIRPETSCAKTETKLMTPLSRSAPTNLYLVHTDHAYQATPPVNIPGSAKFTPNGSSFSISWQSPPVTFTGIPVSNPKLQELKVVSSPLGDVCLLSCFCSPKIQDAGQRSAELQGPRSRVAGGPWPRRGPGTLRESSLYSWALHGQAEARGTCARSARAAQPQHLFHFCSASCTLGQQSGTSSCSLTRGQ
uniref:Zinc finger protein 704 n=1 Tax=Athene cunicularia TaxID=194338 RepID=A0A663MZV6_ATHCN